MKIWVSYFVPKGKKFPTPTTRSRGSQQTKCVPQANCSALLSSWETHSVPSPVPEGNETNKIKPLTLLCLRVHSHCLVCTQKGGLDEFQTKDKFQYEYYNLVFHQRKHAMKTVHYATGFLRN